MDFKVYRISRIGFLTKSYLVYNEDRLVYRVTKLGFFKTGFKMTDQNFNHILKIKNLLSFGFLKFQISDNQGKEIAFVRQQFSFGSTKLAVNSEIGLLLIEGNFTSSEFTISRENQELAKVSRKYFDSKNHINMAVRANVRQDLIIGVVLSIILKIRLSKGN